MTLTPLYRALAADLRMAILEGAIAPGQALPSEHDLQQHHGLSRHTVREALRVLLAEGLIERRRGAGSFVRGSPPEGPFVQTIGGLSDLLQYARTAPLEIFSFRARGASETELRLLGLEGKASHWGRVTGLRRTAPGMTPVALTRILVRAELMPTRAEIEAHGGALGELIRARKGIAAARVTQEIAATALSAAEAQKLAAPARSPALQTIRRYRDAAGDLFQASLSLHPGDRFTYSMDLIRKG